MKELVYHFFSDDDFLRISDSIKKAELITAGEIRVSIKEYIEFSDRNKTLKELAEKEFYRLNMHQTRDKTGILLFFLLSERKFYILADKGINDKVDQSTWDNVSKNITDKFVDGFFTEGIIQGIQEVAEILSNYFPIKEDDTNELNNKVVI